jgi:predicted Rossmann fold nucleotide-binding protein DprA/Smf involved in DNA uptake
MSSHQLTSDTQAILLLCASFGNSRDSYPQPLSLGEYNSLAQWLLEHKLRPADILDLKGQELLQQYELVNLDRLESLLARGMMMALAVDKWTSQGLWIVGRGDRNYPARLKQQLGANAPAVLYGVGNIGLLSQGGLAVVGSRNVGEDEIEYTKTVAYSCARNGIQIISGGARGVDTAAMLGAIDAGGTVVGMLADSLAKSSVSAKYRDAIQQQRLTLISAVDPQAGFNVGNAMGRNKYIYALANYGLVVTSDYDKGGTWAGAVEVLKLEKGVPLFVKADENISSGNKQLLKLGANKFPFQPWGNNLKQRLTESIDIKKSAFELIQCSLPLDMIESQSEPSVENISVIVDRQNVSSDCYQNVIEKSTISSSIYEAVLPFILNNLEQPLDIKSLAKKLDINQVQLQYWLKKAMEDKRIVKINKPVRYALKNGSPANMG